MVTQAQAESQRESEALARLLGRSPAAERLRRDITRVAQVSSPVLIRGETGTGKELVARAVHDMNPRANGPFVAINCSAVPGSLFEAHLFGHERGAFTGADKAAPGYFERAGAGTILLDEVGDLPLELQPKILRVLETRCFVPLGGVTEMTLRARVLAATHVNLEERVKKQLFRADLFHRLNVLRIRVPSLAERREDIPLLARSFMRAQGIELSQSAIEWLTAQRWPGNVRELRNVIERAGVFAPNGVVSEAALRECVDAPQDSDGQLELLASALASLPGSWPDKVAAVERHVFEAALRASGGNANAASRLLGVERKVVGRRIEKFGIAQVGDNDIGEGRACITPSDRRQPRRSRPPPACTARR